MAKKIRLGINSLVKIKEGVNILAEAVKVTLGPKGRTVILHRGLGSHHVTKDGVTVAKDVEFEDSVMDMACKLVKQVARNTAELAGDGTTTSITLINAMFNNAYDKLAKKTWWMRKPKFTNTNPMDIKRGMEKAVEDTVQHLKDISKTIKGYEELKDIALISSNGDKSMGESLFKIYETLGDKVKITRDANPSVSGKDDILITEGYNFDRGYTSPSFTNTRDNTICRLDNPMFALIPGELRDFNEVLGFLELSFLVKRPLVVIADDFEPSILDALVKNNLNPKSSHILALKTPGMGDRKGYNMEDIASAVNYELDVDRKSKKLSEKEVGSCRQIITTSYDTTLILDDKSKDSLNNHVDFLETSLELQTSDYHKGILEDRISKLKGKMALVTLHAATEGEMLERIDRLDDAIEATKSAIEEGYIAGGGLPLYRISKILSPSVGSLKETDDFKKGYRSVLESLKEPFNSILRNGGYDPEEIYKNIPRVHSNDDDYFSVGFNSSTGNYEDLIAGGVIDPVKVTRIALQSAVSTSGVLLTTGCTISLN
jgi:chaperonin GroEL